MSDEHKGLPGREGEGGAEGRGAMNRVSWNRDDDGVIVLYVTDPQGRVAPAADLWLQPLIEKLGLTRAQAKALQEAVAERVSDALVEASEGNGP